MRPQIKPALSWIQRDAETVQIGLDPETAVVLTGLDVRLMRVIRSLNGRNSKETILTKALALGIDSRCAQLVLRMLTEAGAVTDGATHRSPLRGLPLAEQERLTPDLLAHGLTYDTKQHTEGFRRRRAAAVSVHGAGRVGATVAGLLASAGVGRVVVQDDTPVSRGDLAPGGLRRTDLRGSRAGGVCRLIGDVAPSTAAEYSPRSGNGASAEGGPQERLAVLAPDHEPDRRLAQQLMKAGIPHLVVRVRETTAIIGPFVVPGETSCVRCHDLQRAARDPAWPRVLYQMLTRPPRQIACDVVLANSAASCAVAQVLAYLSGDEPPAMDRTIELRLPLTEVETRTWQPHPGCPCQFDPARPEEPDAAEVADAAEQGSG
jgi:bacteriocin biosynthesis cyclodehydratase domain-containing protein